MDGANLDRLAQDQLTKANGSSSGRAAQTIYGDHGRDLRQTVIALRAGQALAEHESPGDATLLVLAGQVRLQAGEESWEGRRGDFAPIPPTRHSLLAVADSAVLLTVATRSDR